MIKSYAKINLSLRILGKKKNKLHDIQSNILLINLFDEIKIKKINNNKDKIFFTGPFSEDVNNNKNSISETLKLLRLKKKIKEHYKVSVKKRIPVFSGLGGGTSNAAFIIKYFIQGKINEKNLKYFENKIGSDLRLFFAKQSYQKSLRKIEKYKTNYNFHLIIVYPTLKCSTKKIYSKVKKYSHQSKVNFSKINSKFLFINQIRKEKNDLQSIVEKKSPKVKRLVEYIKLQKGCYFSRMTGSGSACFGIFHNQKTARAGLTRIKRKFPNYWSLITKTI